MTRPEAPDYEIWIVDRVEGALAVLVDDVGETVVEVGAEALGSRAVEGAVLRVPLGSVGEPLWDRARRDEQVEDELRREAEERLERLRERDPGGDIEI